MASSLNSLKSHASVVDMHRQVRLWNRMEHFTSGQTCSSLGISLTLPPFYWPLAMHSYMSGSDKSTSLYLAFLALALTHTHAHACTCAHTQTHTHINTDTDTRQQQVKKKRKKQNGGGSLQWLHLLQTSMPQVLFFFFKKPMHGNGVLKASLILSRTHFNKLLTAPALPERNPKQLPGRGKHSWNIFVRCHENPAAELQGDLDMIWTASSLKYFISTGLERFKHIAVVLSVKPSTLSLMCKWISWKSTWWIKPNRQK